ncbi:phosphoenolpyruvate carboxykinase [GTP] [Ruminococcus sp. CAG:353]|mgnify:FL=1|jgi:phosphoenolpyruvate carboxykinase (GTP)|uniref:phosphoenolpyruvate carboxykinase (GTP) n=1 Tax=Huintestinicola butyrica TaxID=2981728 RepID=UPI000338D203|nr:phosphoenolpyruvate carboxykinase (GTP) [Huintestinicola butyrica]MCU6727539.1 phosphoenolpyruvate carboxykinase (GTP) [Huintestinicola butyrica]CDE78970.1 phosphoenolpyruvate carboxykinase [GTP] [Ruminococcus sp. CAG:353]SCI83788.1 Phosphoenolpyruvate carboxykinase [GTP] [uncultured Ruminococcus sp.]
MSLTNNPNVLKWVDEMVALTKPDKVVWIDGSKEQLDALTDEVCSLPEGNRDKMYRLNQEKLPGCLYHRTLPNDVARVEDRTFICTPTKEEAGPTNNWMDPKEMYAKLTPLYDGVMKGRTMYVIPYSMGPIGSPLAKVGVELTDSIYVVLNMNIMTRMGKQAFENLGDTSNDFVRGLHSKADVDPENRYIVQFPQDNTIWSINSAYGGNVLLGKKCFALRIASYQGKNEGWMAEHMLILGVKKPDGKVVYITAAFPSACGKTNLAMLIPPKTYKDKGYEVFTVGDDIAWMKPGADGRLYAINPENGFFGVAPGTNAKSNYNALASTMKNTIFTNVALNNADNTVWWEGLDKNPPEDATEWKGAKVNGKEYTSVIGADGKPQKLAHPNSRFTAPAVNCPCVSPEFNNPNGVPVSAIIFGGRRASTTPLVYQSFDWTHGTYIGSAVSSETTAAAVGAVGVLRHDPMAMKPFIGYNVGDYWAHWLEMGEKLGDKAPKIFNVNWFKQDEEGHFMWPGFGDNMRVLDWIIKRCEGTIDAEETAIGYLPKKGDINLEGIEDEVTPEILDKLLYVDKDLWKKEIAEMRRYYKEDISDKGGHIPAALIAQLDKLEERLNK